MSEVKGKNLHKSRDIVSVKAVLQLTVLREGNSVILPPFEPRTIGLHPTQIYETISMCLLLFFLLSYYPYKRHDGELMVLLMVGYGVHRFLNEMLRLDVDPGWFGTRLTLSHEILPAVLLRGSLLAGLARPRPAPH